MEDKTKNILIAAGSGIAVGAVLGILFAPASGKETRKNIATKANSAKEAIVEKATEAKEAIVENKEMIAESIVGLKGNVKSLFKDSKDLTKEQLEQKIKELEEILKSA